MRHMIKHATTEELINLYDMIPMSGSATNEQAALLHSIVVELTERLETLDKENDYSFLRILARYEDVRATLPEDEQDPINVILAIFQDCTEEEIQAFNDGISATTDWTEEKIAAREENIIRKILNDTQFDDYKPRRRFLRPALVAASIVAVLFIGNIAAYAAGFDILGAMARWTKDTVSFVFGSADTEGQAHTQNPEYQHFADKLNGHGIQIDLPTHIPARFAFYTIEQAELDEQFTIYSWFESGDDEFSISVKRIDNSNPLFIEVNGTEQSETYKGKYLIAKNNSRNTAVWHQGIYEIQIQGSLTIEELKQILDSI